MPIEVAASPACRSNPGEPEGCPRLPSDRPSQCPGCVCVGRGVDRLCHPDPIYLVTPYPAAPTPSCVVLQVSVDGPEAETQAEETPGSLHQVCRPTVPLEDFFQQARVPAGLPSQGSAVTALLHACRLCWVGVGADVC